MKNNNSSKEKTVAERLLHSGLFIIIVIVRGAKVKVEIVTGRISNCHCEEEHGSDVAISTDIKGIIPRSLPRKCPKGKITMRGLSFLRP